MKQLYQGSCHCGKVRFECQYDLAPAGKRSKPKLPGIWWTTTFRCNCSHCAKARYWKGFVPDSEFTLLSGKDSLSKYVFGVKEIHHYFCKTCGIQIFASSFIEELGGDFYCINIACLDNVDPKELASAPVVYEDGKNDAWDKSPAETAYL